ncbi:MAG: hypothetical protein CMQ34_08960 [Gammaproteobacteria bacterium]|nr:hypothetical protein [Gammaproteobacteria bacterium]
MDFFRAQDVARRKTGRLVLLFALAIISLIAITNALVLVTLGLTSTSAGGAPVFTDVEPAVFVSISLAVLAVVGFGSLYKTLSLRSGGAQVAESLGARLLLPGSGNIHEQRALNIVEEMAIASATPVPPVYLLDEDAINAFAAGFSPSDAVIGVTRGAIVKLSREELQGVIAHEFSHILHGDMRLNIRLIGLLHGILVLGLMGYYLMRTAGVSRRSKNGNGVIFLGLGLVVIGAAGTFFGNLIKAAVSRQREFLADASAVQYTRNADGIAGALKQIGRDQRGSRLDNPGAREISHALFSQGVKTSFATLFATHPPLTQRIRRLQPQWDGEFDESPAPGVTGQAPDHGSTTAARQRSDAALGIAAVAALQRAGAPDSADVQEASRIRRQLAPAFLRAAHEPHGARALIYFLLLDPLPDNTGAAGTAAQHEYLAVHADAGVYQELAALIRDREQLAVTDRLALINIALSALRQLSPAQFRMFEKNMQALMQMSGEPSLMAWVYHFLVLTHLRPVFGGAASRSARRRLEHCAKSCQVTLSVMAHLGQAGDKAGHAFSCGAAHLRACLPALARAELLSRQDLNRESVQSSLTELQQLQPRDKQMFLLAAAACIQSDGKLTAAEQVLFQTCAEILDCPTPALF